MRLILGIVAGFSLLVAPAFSRPLDDSPKAPPRPAIPPMITYPVELDMDRNGVDDAIEARIDELRIRSISAGSAAKRRDAIAQLQAPIRVELLFSGPIAQADLDAFQQLGGHVEHVFTHISYGWGGMIQLNAAPKLPARMSKSFMTVIQARPMYRDMDEATRTSRTRPVWAAGFAGSASGFQGNADTAIAIIDTGVDGTHPDLAGRMRYWKDWDGGSSTPVDYDGHGTMAAGIAVGTGATLGANPSLLHFTDSADLTGVNIGSFKPWPLHLPPGPVTMSLTGVFNGGGQATLTYAYSNNGVVSYTLGSPSSTGGSPRSITANFTATAARRYTTYLSRSSGTVSLFAVTGTTTYAGVGDGFNALSGVAPGCWWVGHKVYGDDGSGGDTGVVSYALDECIAYNTTYNIKVINLSLSTGSAYSPIRNKVNTCAANGMIVTVSAGNSGPSGIMTDPARARLAITASASSDINQLADYPSNGGFTQESNTDYKPDLAPPGGSKYQTHILSVDANQSDAGSPSFADQYANDYTNTRGTSMSAPHAAGVAALVINALEAGGLTWSFTSDEHPRLVKMLLCATATETNTAREGGMNNPTLGRAAAPRDNYEGYGLINCDAAIEAAYQTLAPGATINDTTAGGQFDRRAWGRRVALTAGVPIHLDLTVPDGADYDLYLYYGGGTPDPQGLPVILASSTSPSTGADETIDHTPASSETAYVVIKRISGGGAWSLHYPSAMGITVISPNGGETWQLGTTHTIQWSYSGALGPNVRIELLRSGSPIGTIASSVSIGSGGSGSYSWTIPIGFGASSTDTIRITSVETPAITDTSDSAFSLTRIPTTLYTVDRVGIITERITLKAYDLKRTTDNALLPSQTITFRIDGTAVGTATTDAGGDAALNWDITEGPSTRTIKAEFDQDASYLGSSHTATLTAQSWTTKIATFDRTQRISGRTELKARLLRSDNVPLYNKSIDFSVDGAFVITRPTDVNGYAKYPYYDVPDGAGAGPRTILSVWAGNGGYAPVSGTATLTVQKALPYIWVMSKSVASGGIANLYAYFRRLYDLQKQKDKTVVFKIDGTPVQTVVTNNDGVARYLYPTVEAPGAHTIRCEFGGDAWVEAGYGNGTLTIL